MQLEVHIFTEKKELFQAAAEIFIQHAQAAIQDKGAFFVALSGGETPRDLYALLATDPVLCKQMPWRKSHFFWGDERHVPPEDKQSDYRMAYETMLSIVPIPPEHIHRIPAENPDANQISDMYEKTIRQVFNLTLGQFPRFDLVLLGLGADGHTASLFPGSRALQEHRRLVAANWIEKLRAHRITLTLPVLNNAACVLFLVTGREKAKALQAVLEGQEDANDIPARLISPNNGKLIWLVDQAAASQLYEKSSRM